MIRKNSGCRRTGDRKKEISDSRLSHIGLHCIRQRDVRAAPGAMTNRQPGSNEWCFFGKKRDGFGYPLIYCDLRVVESWSVLIKPAGITAFFHDPTPLKF